jgi:PKD repeat protein
MNRIFSAFSMRQGRLGNLKPSVFLTVSLFLLLILTLTGSPSRKSQPEFLRQNKDILYSSTSSLTLTGSTRTKAKQTITDVATTNNAPASPDCPDPITGLTADNDSPTLLCSPTTLTATIATGSNVVYTWNFGDELEDNGAIVSHTYPQVGFYTAVVTATNSLGHISATTTVTVTPNITGLTADNDSPTLLGSPTTLTATIVTSKSVAYTWDFGVGYTDSTGVGEIVSYTYPAVGVYTAVVTATNNSPASPDCPILITATTTATVTPNITGLTAVNDSPTLLGNPTTLTATIATGKNVTYTWDFGVVYTDSTGVGDIVSYTYPAVGVYAAVVTATDPPGLITSTTTVTVAAPPEFGSFEPTNWVTLTRSPICSIEARDLDSDLDANSARYRWSSSGPEHLQQQPWLSATVSGDYGTTAWQTITATVPFTQDSSSQNLVQFAIADTLGFSATSPTTQTVKIDTTAPGPWQGFTREPAWDVEVTAGQLVTYTITVSDTISGLNCSKAFYQYWTKDGWSDWKPAARTAVCTGTVGITTPQVIGAPSISYMPHSSTLMCDNENKVRFRIADVAGHCSTALRQEEYCVYLPALMKCYPPCCDVPLNGDFAISENSFAAHWNRDSDSPLHVDRTADQKIFMGYDENERIRLPGMGRCVFAHLYQTFYLPGGGCYSNLQLQFDYQLFSYDYDRSNGNGDTFVVYIDDLNDRTQYLIYSDQSHQSREDSLNDELYVSDPTTPVEPLPASLGSGPVRLWFEVRYCEKWPYEWAWWPTWVYLDSVTITGPP